MDVADSIARRWHGLCDALGVEPELAHTTGRWLLDAYNGADRHYHDHRHLLECLAVIDARDLDQRMRLAAEVAIFFHDVVYHPAASDNEHRSAVAAEEFLGRIDRRDLAAEVTQAIEMTAGHATTVRSPVLDAVHDADLAILGATPQRYDDYARAIRAEYAHVPDADFAIGRAGVLRSFLAQPRLYVGPDTAGLEHAARANISRELATLAQP